MRDKFPKENYKKACAQLKPSGQSVKEVIFMKKPGKHLWRRRKTFAGAAASAALICFLSVGVMAADTDISEVAQAVAGQISMVFKNLTVDNGASAPYETVCYAEDGTKLSFIHGYGENGEFYVQLIYHEDQKRLGLKIGEEEEDITEVLSKNGSYTQEYTWEGKRCRLTVTGKPENAKLETEVLENEE